MAAKRRAKKDGPKRVPELVKDLYDEDPKVMRTAVRAFTESGGEVRPGHLPVLLDALGHPDPQARYAVLCGLAELGPHLLFEKRVAEKLTPGIPQLIRIVGSSKDDKDGRSIAMRLLAYAGMPAPQAVAPLTRLVKDKDPTLRNTALATLAALGGKGHAVVAREFKNQPAKVADGLNYLDSMSWASFAHELVKLLESKDPAVVKAATKCLDELVRYELLPRGVKYNKTALQIRDEERVREPKKKAKTSSAKKTAKKKKKQAKSKSSKRVSRNPWKVMRAVVAEAPGVAEGIDAFVKAAEPGLPAELLDIIRKGWKDDLKKVRDYVEKIFKKKPKPPVNVITFAVVSPVGRAADLTIWGHSGFSPEAPDDCCAPSFDSKPAYARSDVLRSIALLGDKEKVDIDDSYLASYLFTGLITAQICREKWKLMIAGAEGSRYVQYGYADGEQLLGEITKAGWSPIAAE